MKEKIFAIIVIYNGMRNDWIQKCFDSILTSSIPVDIIAIDNGSTDGSIDFIKENYPQVDFTVSEENLGFGKANNIGLRKALDKGGDYFFLLNQDAWVESNTIEELVKQAKINPEYGVISPLHLNGKGEALDYSFSLYIQPEYCKNLYSDFVLGKSHKKIYESDFICAAAWLISKECLKVIGGFSPTFFHYGEDDNYIHRLKYYNLKIGVYPSVKIYHDREQRKINFMKDNSFNIKKSVLLNYSNPNNSNNIDKTIKILTLKIFFRKYLIGGNDTLEFMLLQRNTLLKYKNIIKENLKISQNNQQYVFLD